MLAVLNYSAIRTHLLTCTDLDEVFCEREDRCGFKATVKREDQSDHLPGALKVRWF